MAKQYTIDRRKMLARVKLAVDHGFSATRIGYVAAGDPMFVHKLRDGWQFRQMTLLRAYQALEEFDTPRMSAALRELQRKSNKTRKNAVLRASSK